MLITDHKMVKEDFELKLDIPNEATVAAIEEGRKLMSDPSVKRYSDAEEALRALKE